MRGASTISRAWIGCCALVLLTFPAFAQDRRQPIASNFPDNRESESPAENRERPKSNDARDLGKESTGVFVNSAVGQGGYAPDFMFRGFENGGMTLYDGTARGFISGGVELVGVEQVQFVKGVTSLLYGVTTSASGAAANYITKKPEQDFFLRGSATLGSFAFRRTTIDINTPLNDNKTVLFRVNVAAQDKNSFTNFLYSDGVYVNPALTFIFENGDRLSLRGEYGIRHYLTNFGWPTYQSSPLLLRLPRGFYAAVPANERDWYTQFDGRLKYEHDFNKDWSANIVLDYFGSFNPYGWYTQWQYDGSRSIVLGEGARTHYFAKNFDVQATVRGKFNTAILTHNVFAGVERWAFYTRHRDRIDTDPIGFLDIFAPIYSGFVNYALARQADGDDSGWTNSAFAQDLIDIGDRWRVLIGGRYDYLASYQTLNDPTGALSGTPGSTASKGFKPKVSPRAGVMFRPFDSTSIHAAYGQSFIPNIGVRLVGGKLAPPEEDTLYEIGLRQSFFNRKVEVDVGVFDVTRKNVPSNDPTNPNGFYQLVTGQQHSHGVEASVAAQVTPNLRFGAAATLLHALVTNDSNTPSQKGSDLLGAPRRVYNLSANYTFDSGILKGLDLGANFYYAGETQATLPNTRGFTLPPIRNLSLSATYKLNDRFTLTVSAANLTDSANFTSNGALFRGEPRTISGAINYVY